MKHGFSPRLCKMDRDKLYQRLFTAYRKRYSDEKGQVVQQKCNELWKEIKNDKNVAFLVDEKVKSMGEDTRKQSISSFFEKMRNTKVITTTNDGASKELGPEQDLDDSSDSSVEICESQDPFPTSSPMNSPLPSVSNQKIETPAQDAISKKIILVQTDLNALYKKRSLSVIDSNGLKTIRDLEQELKQLKRLLDTKRRDQQRSKERRMKQRETLLQVSRNESVLSNSDLHIREKRGRPSLDEDQPGIVKTILEIVNSSASAHERRQMETLNTCKTVDSLKKALEESGYTISRSATYLRLLPKRAKTNEALRHINPAPVKLLRARDDLHKGHDDTMFCKASIEHLKELASFLGNNQVMILSQDDKAKVPIGIPAASKQTALMMNVEYRVRLPDHTFPVAAGYKLVPSVYMALKVLNNNIGNSSPIKTSGPTYISIRSAKYSGSSSETHKTDFEKILTLDEFKAYTHVPSHEDLVKPVLMFFVDGGPDQNPRYKTVIANAMDMFKKYDLDAVFIATNAPGRSAFNPVEHRMAPLSRALSGLILPAHHFKRGDSNLTQKEIELKNFKHAGIVIKMF